MQYAKRLGPGRQHGYGHAAELEVSDLEQTGVRQAGRTDSAESESTMGKTFRDAGGVRHAQKATDRNQEGRSDGGWDTGAMSTAAPLKDRFRTDLTTAMKARDKVRSSTIRMVLSAITEAEVAGKTAVELSDAQVLDVVVREAKKRRESAEAFIAADRLELAAKEQTELAVLADYLPQQLSAEEVSAVIAEAIASTGAAELGPRGMGKVMAVVTPATKGKADGGAVAAEVKRQLAALG